MSVAGKYWDTILPHLARAVDMSRTFKIKLSALSRPLEILSKLYPFADLRHLWLEWRTHARNDDPIDKCVDLSQAVFF